MIDRNGLISDIFPIPFPVRTLLLLPFLTVCLSLSLSIISGELIEFLLFDIHYIPSSTDATSLGLSSTGATYRHHYHYDCQYPPSPVTTEARPVSAAISFPITVTIKHLTRSAIVQEMKMKMTAQPHANGISSGLLFLANLCSHHNNVFYLSPNDDNEAG